MCAAGLAWGVVHFSGEYAIYTLLAEPGSLPAGEAVAWLFTWLWAPSLGLVVFLELLFPTGRMPYRRWRPFAWLSLFITLIASVLSMFAPGPIFGLGPIRNPLGIEGWPSLYEPLQSLMLAFIFVGSASMIGRLRRARGVERQQVMWPAYTVVMAAIGSSITYTLSEAIGVRWLEGAGFFIFIAALLGFHVSIGIAIVRYRLYDIDIFINRTLVYGALTASVVSIYVFVVGYLGSLFHTTSGNLFVSLVATGLVAVLFAPLRDYLQRGVNRLMYGERDDPYSVVSRLGERLEATLAPEAVLPTIVETVREALKLPYAAIALSTDGSNTSTTVGASIGKPTQAPLRLPLTYQSELVGELLLGTRAPGETFSAADRRLLEGLARQAGVAVYAVRLATELQRSRERLVGAREEERRRLRRDLHDGLGAHLAALSMQAATIRRLIETDP